MRVVQDCHLHNSKLSHWCNFCQQKQIEDCQTCQQKRIERISEILSSKGHTRTEYANALKAVMNQIYCDVCMDAQSFDHEQEAWPYNESEMKRFEKSAGQRE